jgi:replication-associated recombination protein RarA|tara:strand:+ start:1354 stop:1683 length:330 start_codon:yes stop_codon:yes gene_type:complete
MIEICFAEIDPKTNLVKRVIVADKKFIKQHYKDNIDNWIETSTSKKFRNVYAAKGYKYDKKNDVFIEPKPYASWKLDNNFKWQPPKPKPKIKDKIILWNEEKLKWEILN